MPPYQFPRREQDELDGQLAGYFRLRHIDEWRKFPRQMFETFTAAGHRQPGISLNEGESHE
jgi:hypothetical protein